MLALPTILAASLAAAPLLTTEAERSGFVRTGRYAEVETLCRELPKRFPGKVRCDSFGTTPEGRPMLALAFSQDGVLTPSAAAKKKRPVVLFQGGIHAGEIDGKDAGFWLMREVLEGKALPGVLSKVTAVFVPVFNVDGHERFGKNQRPNQRGPEEMGWRVTGQNLNLNRDYAKADAPEMRAMLRLLDRWMPILYLDLHVTNGAEFEHDISVTMEPLRGGAPQLRPIGRQMLSALFEKLSAQGHLPVDFYPSFVRDDDPASGFAVNVAPPRFSHGYWALKNRFGVLVETHAWKDYPHRVKTTRHVLEGFLSLAAEHGRQWQQEAERADEEDTAASNNPIELAFAPKPDSARTIPFRGYEYTRKKSDVAATEIVTYDRTKPQIWNVPLIDEVVVTANAKPPSGGYLVPAAYADRVKPVLEAHGLLYLVLAEAASFSVEAFRATETKLGAQSFEGRQTLDLVGTWKPETMSFPNGSLFVPANQPGRRLVLALFEPESNDSFVSWGTFNAAFEQKEYIEDYVLEPWAREQLAKDAALKVAFEERLKDARFANDPRARLRFFAVRHPAWDARYGLYPVVRTSTDPLARR